MKLFHLKFSEHQIKHITVPLNVNYCSINFKNLKKKIQ